MMLFDPARDVATTIAARTRRPRTASPDIDDATYALKLAAARFGEAWNGRPYRYGEVERALRQCARRRHRHGADAATLLPDRYEIENALATPEEAGWDHALRLAGLPPRRPAAGSPAGNDPVELAGRFYDELGCLPWSARALRDYAERKGESLADFRNRVGPVVAALRARRADARTDAADGPAASRPAARDRARDERQQTPAHHLDARGDHRRARARLRGELARHAPHPGHPAQARDRQSADSAPLHDAAAGSPAAVHHGGRAAPCRPGTRSRPTRTDGAGVIDSIARPRRHAASVGSAS